MTLIIALMAGVHSTSVTVESMLKQAGADAESIKQLNRVLQGIKKDV